MAKEAQKTQEVQKLVDRTYRLASDRSGLTYLIKSGKSRRLLMFDEEKGVQRAIRNCPNEGTIFVDEQSKFALVDVVMFTNGYLDIPAQSQVTQQFLKYHPDNVANGGSLFEEVNEEQEAQEEVEYDDLVIDIKSAVRAKLKEEGGIALVEAVVASIENSFEVATSMTKEELKRTIYREADNNPYQFTDDAGNCNIFEDNDSMRKHFILKAVSEGIIKTSLNGRSMLWKKGDGVIATAPVGMTIVDYMVAFLETEEGMLVSARIEDLT